MLERYPERFIEAVRKAHQRHILTPSSAAELLRVSLDAATKLGIETRRTHCLLVEAVSAGRLSRGEARSLHAGMRANGFWDDPWV